MSRLLLLTILAAFGSLAPFALAAPAETAAVARDNEQTVTDTDRQPNAESDAGQAAEEKATGSLPEAGQLRQRDLGDAFRNFKPSEEISADNAVSFPVDI
ncbi:MAG: hypothetical protein ACPGPD_05905 [Pseudomonadales bacterium]